MPQIECKDISLGYNGMTVSEHISFTVDRGDYLCIVGDNGSGKSTLMKAILGLKAPDSGEIAFGDETSATDIGYLPQQSENIHDFPASVMEIVMSGFAGKMGLRPFYTRTEKEKARSNMEKMGILHLEHCPFSSLSGGQRQRVLLARALCAACRILLLDEPVSGLDPNATAELYSVIDRLNKDSAITVIMITHDISAALKCSNKILHMGAIPELFDSIEDYKNTHLFSDDGKKEGGEKNA